MCRFKSVFLKLCTALIPLAVAACTGAISSTPPTTTCLTECTPRIGIMAAFGQEADLLQSQMQDARVHLINGNRFLVGKLENQPTVVVLSGISMPNAIMVAQLMINHFDIRQLMFSGISGGVDPARKVGDVLIPRAWIMPQEIYHASGTALPRPCGTPGDLSCLGLEMAKDYAPYGGDRYLLKTNVLNAKNHDQLALKDSQSGAAMAYGEMLTDYPVDPTMLAVMGRNLAAIQATLEPICVSGGACTAPEIAITKRGASGGTFLANPDYRDYLYKQLKVDSVDMETAGVAHVAYANSIPFIAFRSLSDLAGSDTAPEEIGQFFGSGIAQRNAARVTLGFLRAWGSGSVTR